jgi:O-acetyl-ADP-ribose deacetylase (regulator of RNase III)
MTDPKRSVVLDSHRNQGEIVTEKMIGSVKFQVNRGVIWLQRIDAIVSPCESTKLIYNPEIAEIMANYAGP